MPRKGFDALAMEAGPTILQFESNAIGADERCDQEIETWLFPYRSTWSDIEGPLTRANRFIPLTQTSLETDLVSGLGRQQFFLGNSSGSGNGRARRAQLCARAPTIRQKCHGFPVAYAAAGR